MERAACRQPVRRKRLMYPSAVPLTGAEHALSGALQHRIAFLAPDLQHAIEALVRLGILDHALPAGADPWPQPIARQSLQEIKQVTLQSRMRLDEDR